ncbi:MAG TPA: substrate-binding domain-containing protein [Clostridiaceae bacterium]|nr:substrate-binding domain-containing protein [Clostridiaceae bacterium]
MKKFLTVVVSVAMVMAMAMGCGGGSKDPVQTDAPDDSTQTEATEVDSSSETETPDATGTPEVGDIGLGPVEANEEYKIGCSIAERDQFLSFLQDAIVSEALAIGLDITALDAGDDSNLQLQHVQSFVNQGYDAIIMNLVDAGTVTAMEEMAGDIPIIYVNRTPGVELTKGESVYIGSNENFSGRYQGEFLAEYFNAKGMTDVKAVLLRGGTSAHADSRSEEAMKALADGGINVDYVFDESAGWSRVKAFELVNQFLVDDPEFDCIISNNDEMAIGAISALEVNGIEPSSIPIVGIDATPQALAQMQDGALAFTVYQDADAQGINAVRATVMILNGDDVDTLVDIPFEPVTVENYQDFMK